MTNLERKIAEMLDERARDVHGSPGSWARITQRIATRDAVPGPRLPVAAIVATTAVVAVAAALTVPTWLRDGQQSVAIDPAAGATAPSDGATPPATGTPDPEVTEDAPTETAAPAPDTGGGYTWRESGTAVADEELWVRDVHVDGSRIVVAGGGTLWGSADDGETWDPISEQALGTPGSEHAEVHAVTGTPDELLAVGGTYQQGIVWRSSDGVNWQGTALDDAGLLYDVAYADGQLVATGRRGSRAAAYVSTDGGRNWDGTEVEAAGEGVENGMFVVAHGPAGWVASGYGAGSDGLATFWTSPDARSWSLVPEPGVTGELGVIDAIASNANSYLAMRAGGEVYHSTDAHQWTQVAHLGPDGQDDDPSLRIGDVASTPQGWLAVGDRFGSDHPPHAYTSSDGATWTAEVIADRGDARGLALAQDGSVVVVGQSEGGCEADVPCPTLVGWHGVPVVR